MPTFFAVLQWQRSTFGYSPEIPHNSSERLHCTNAPSKSASAAWCVKGARSGPDLASSLTLRYPHSEFAYCACWFWNGDAPVSTVHFNFFNYISTISELYFGSTVRSTDRYYTGIVCCTMSLEFRIVISVIKFLNSIYAISVLWTLDCSQGFQKMYMPAALF